MKKQPKAKTIEIALLLDDMAEIKKFSTALRDLGIIAYFYENLQDFWNGVLERTPQLSIVDVKKMGEQNLLLKNHPLIRSEHLPVAFFYKDSSKLLLNSTHQLFHFGFINENDNYVGCLKGLLKRVHKYLGLELDLKVIESKNQRLKGKMNDLMEFVQVGRQKEYYEQVLKAIINKIESNSKTENFYDVCINALASIREVSKISYMQLSPNRQKLFSPDVNNSKYIKMPSVWLGESNKNGLGPYSQNLASQVALDIIGGELMTLLIKGKESDPEKIIFIRANDEEFLNNFDWNSFELYLHGLNNAYENIDNSVDNNQERLISPWRLHSLLDQDFYRDSTESGQFEDENVLIDIDFTNLVDSMFKRVGSRFYWDRFFKDFINKFIYQYKSDFLFCPFGIKHLAIVVHKDSAGELFKQLKAYAIRFPLWQYFEESDKVLIENLRPVVKMVPYSTDAYTIFRNEKVQMYMNRSIQKQEFDDQESNQKKNSKAVEKKPINRNLEFRM